MSTIVNKPWGREVLLTDSDLPYCGKLLHLKAGHRISLQYHDQKTETLSLIIGQVQIQTGQAKDSLQTIMMEAESGYTIKPGEIHRLIAVTDATILEISTPETGTTFRLEDDYQRGDESPLIRNLPNRGWHNESHT